MKVPIEAKVPVYDIKATPTLLNKKLTIEQASGKPEQDQPQTLSSLSGLMMPGTEFYLKPLGIQGLLGRLNLPSTATTLSGASIPNPLTASAEKIVATLGVSIDKAAVEKATAGAADANKGEPWAKALGHVSASGIAAGSFHLMGITQDMTQAQAVGHLQTLGMAPATADTWATHAFDLMNTHGAHAVLAGVSVGSATVEFLGVLRPAMPMPKRVAIGSVVAVVVGLLFFFFAYRPDPFDGKWVASPSEARYELGIAPQSATCTISSQGTRLTISEDDMLPNGSIEHQKYKLDADGAEHKAPAGLGAETVVASVKDRTMDVDFKSAGKQVRHEVRSLSSDRKEMTVTVTGTDPAGKTYQNTSLYEKK